MCLLCAVTIMINVVATYCMYSLALAYKYDILCCFDKATVVHTSNCEAMELMDLSLKTLTFKRQLADFLWTNFVKNFNPDVFVPTTTCVPVPNAQLYPNKLGLEPMDYRTKL